MMARENADKKEKRDLNDPIQHNWWLRRRHRIGVGLAILSIALMVIIGFPEVFGWGGKTCTAEQVLAKQQLTEKISEIEKRKQHLEEKKETRVREAPRFAEFFNAEIADKNDSIQELNQQLVAMDCH